MNKTEKLIREYVLSKNNFTFYTQIAENTIWGFKYSPYKKFDTAMKKVKEIIQKMLDDNLVDLVEYEDYQPMIIVK